MDEKLPEKPDKAASGSANNSDTRILAIRELHYHGNDLAELRKIAEQNPALAAKIVDQRDQEDSRFNVSYRFGIVGSLVLVGMLLCSVTMLLINVGIWATLGLTVVILAVALLIRVILTGEWSDTTWFGKFVSLLAKALGSKSDE